jgi:hypothetical protein
MEMTNNRQMKLRLFQVIEGTARAAKTKWPTPFRAGRGTERNDADGHGIDNTRERSTSPPPQGSGDDVNAKVNELRARLRKGDFPELSGSERFVLMLRCDSYNPATGRCDESQANLAREIKRSVRTVRRIDDRLESLGFLKRTGGGRGTPNNYEPTIPARTPDISSTRTPDISSANPGHFRHPYLS